MNVHLVAFVLGLIAQVRADVSHLAHHQQSSFASTNTLGDQNVNGQSFVYSAGNEPKRFWWMNTRSSPFTKTHETLDTPQNIIENTLHKTQEHQLQNTFDYSQNPFLKSSNAQQLHYTIPSTNNIYARMQKISGSPTEVNSLMTDTFVYQPARNIPCYGATQVCAPKDACHDGYISESNLGLVRTQSNLCNSHQESCCNIQPVEQPQEQSSQCADANSACVSSKFCFNGYIDQSAVEKAVRPKSGYCYAPEICCRFDQRRSATFIQDNAFAAAESTSEILTKEGYVVNVPSNKYLPSIPETEYNPDSTNTDSSRLRPDRPSTQAPTPVITQAPQRPTPQRPISPQNIPTQPPRPIQTQPPRPIQTQPPKLAPTQTPIRDIPQVTQRPASPPPRTDSPKITQRPFVTQQQPQQPNFVPQSSQPRPQFIQQDLPEKVIHSGCAAAMNCTPIEYCTGTAVISKTPIKLTPQQELFRVPMTDCTIPATNQPGKCCRDPDYTDPWPIGRNGQYIADELNAAFDSGAYRPEREKPLASRKIPVRVRPDTNNNQLTANTNQVITRVSAPISRQRVDRPLTTNQKRDIPVNPVQQQNLSQINQGTCGVRNFNTQPRGRAPLGTGFGEFSWVAMVILESKKALLCGGSIVDKNIVVTSANCVNGYRHNDVLIKGGEWRLGNDEEPKPFQIVRVQKIIFHPGFQPKTLENDIALLYLETDLRFDTHIQPICLDETDSDPISSSDECLTTGWGKEVLKVHLGNALMQQTAVSALQQSDCKQRITTSSRLSYTDSLICGITQYDSCEVDVGSALACVDRSGRYTLKGVYSSETECNNPNQVVAFTRADNKWIRKHILQNPTKASYA